MAYPNIERSVLRGVTYVGYDAQGYPWHIVKRPFGRMLYTARPAPNHPGRFTAGTIEHTTLREVSRELMTRAVPAVVEPF